MKLKIIAPSKRDERELFDEEYVSFLYGFNKYSSIPHALPVLAGLTPAWVEVELVDENIQEIDYDDPVDVVAITCNTMLAHRAYQIADEFRSRNVKTVIGGIHATSCFMEAKSHADAVVIGEADLVWAQVLEDIKTGRLKDYYQASGYADLSKAPMPRYDLVKNDRYLFHVIQTTKGCPHKCEFCSVHTICGTAFRYKPVPKIIDEIRFLQKIEDKFIFFCDDNFISNRHHAKNLLKAVAPLNISFFTQCDINVAKDPDLLDLLAAAGCRKLFIGLESVSSASIDAINKSRVNNPETYSAAIESIQARGIEVMGGFVFGMDTDTSEIFDDTIAFVQASGLSYPAFSILTPYPGSALYTRFMNEGRIFHHDWRDYDATHVCFHPQLLSVGELQAGFNKVYKEVFSYENIFQRMHQLWMLWNENQKRHATRLLPLIGNLEALDFASRLEETEHYIPQQPAVSLS